MLRRTTASPRPASGAGVRSMRARPATSATRSRRPVAKWPNASSAGASNTARCARPNIEASQPSLPTSCSISSPTISCAFPSSSPPEAEPARKPENRFGQTEIQQQRTETAWLPQVFQQTARRAQFHVGAVARHSWPCCDLWPDERHQYGARRILPDWRLLRRYGGTCRVHVLVGAVAVAARTRNYRSRPGGVSRTTYLSPFHRFHSRYLGH